MRGLDDEDAFDRALRRLPGVRPNVVRVSRRGMAKVIKLGNTPDRAPTEPLPVYNADAVATAWIAEHRERGGRP
jgi:hypothetical protein